MWHAIAIRRHVARGLLAVGALAGSGMSAAAQDYPTRPIRIIVGFTAGGPTDIPARFLAERLAAALGRPVVVENKPGAGASLAANEVLSRPREGYDLLLCTYFDAINTLMYRSIKYRLSELLGISLIARYSYAVAVANTIPAQTFPELVAYAKQHPNEVNYGHLGVGSTQMMIAKRLEKLTGMRMTAIPYKGTTEGVQELIAGRNHVQIGPPIGVVPYYLARQLKVLAVTGDERLAAIPEVPTLKESGVDVAVDIAIDVYGSGNAPPALVTRMNAVLLQAISNADVLSRILAYGLLPAPSSADELAQKQIEETKLWAAPIKASGFTGE